MGSHMTSKIEAADEVDLRSKAIVLLDMGLTVADVASKLQRDISWVYKWKSRHKAAGNVNDKPRCVRPKS